MTFLVPSRRRFLTGLSALFVAPAIVRASTLMPISLQPLLTQGQINQYLTLQIITREAMRLWATNNVFLQINEDYRTEFKLGDTVRVRPPKAFVV